MSLKGYVLDNGRMFGPTKTILSNAAPDELSYIPIYSVLLQHKDGNVLFDAGCHVDESRQTPFILEGARVKDEDHIISRLAEIGFSPEDINYLVLSHLHADHTGYIELFPNAEIYVSDNEFTNTIKQYALGTAVDMGNIEHWIKCKLKWKLLPDKEEMIGLLDGITIVNLGSGHSFGMIALLIDFPKTGKVILTSDAIYTRANIEQPRVPPSMGYDMEGLNNTLDRIAELAANENAAIWYGHDMEQFDGLIKSTEGYYE